jgi:hypothetical protein
MVYMECDYTHLNHNSLVSQKKKKNVPQRCDYKECSLYKEEKKQTRGWSWALINCIFN